VKKIHPLTVSWSPDGEYIAVGGFEGLYIFDRTGAIVWRKEIKELVNDSFVGSISWSPDGQLIAISVEWTTQSNHTIYSHGSVYVLSREGDVLWSSGDLRNFIRTVSWSPDGQYLIVTGPARTLYVFDRNGLLARSKELGDLVWYVSWSPSGDLIAAGLDIGKILLFAVEGYSPKPIVLTVTSTVTESVTVTRTITSSFTATLTITSSVTYTVPVTTTVTTTVSIPVTTTLTITNPVEITKTVTETVTSEITRTETVTTTSTATYTVAVSQGISMEVMIVSIAILLVGIVTALIISRRPRA